MYLSIKKAEYWQGASSEREGLQYLDKFFRKNLDNFYR